MINVTQHMWIRNALGHHGPNKETRGIFSFSKHVFVFPFPLQNEVYPAQSIDEMCMYMMKCDMVHLVRYANDHDVETFAVTSGFSPSGLGELK